MPRNITVTFDDGSKHVYQNAPDDLTPAQVTARAQSDFGRTVTALDGGRGAALSAAAASAPEAPRSYALSEVPLAALKNAPQSAGEMVAGLGHALAHPIDTLKGLVDLGAGALRNSVPDSVRQFVDRFDSDPVAAEKASATARAVGGLYANRYGSVEGIKRAIAEDPVGVAGDLSMLLGGAAGAAKLAGGAANLAGAGGVAQKAATVADVLATGAKYTNPLTPVVAGVNKAIPIAAKGAGYVTDLVTGNRSNVVAGNIAREAAGPQLNAIQAANAMAPADVNAMQAAYGINRPQWQALGAKMAERDSTNAFQAQAQAQEAARQAVLNRLAGGATQTEAKQAQAATKTALGQVTEPMRESALQAANAGTPALDTSTITNAIESKLKDPKIGVNEVNQKVLNKVNDLIKEWTSRNGGTIDADALYEIRKGAVNSAIETLMPNADAKMQAKRAAGLLKEVRPLIDDAIENAGGTGWRDYLKTFEQGMQQVNQGKMSAAAMQMYKDNPQGFVDLVNGNNPKAVEKVFGAGSFDIAKEMANKIQPLRGVASEVTRESELVKQAAAGKTSLDEILKKNQSVVRLPSFVPYSNAVNNLLGSIKGTVNSKTLDALEKGFQSGKDVNELLGQLPANERLKVLQAISKMQVSPTVPNAFVRVQNASQNAMNQ